MAGGRSGRPVVLHVTECFEGGVGRALRNIAKFATFADHHLLGFGADLAHADARAPFASITQLPAGKVAQLRATRAHLRSTSVDFVHAHSSWAGVYVRTAAVRTSLIYQPHGYAFEMSGRLRAAGYFAAEKILSMRPQQIAVLSPRERELVHRLAPDKHARDLTNLPTVAVVSSRRTSHAPIGPIRVAMNGRLSRQKDPAFFADVIHELRLRGVPIEPVWIGDGDEVMRQALEGLGVRVTGWLDSDEIIDELDGTHLYLHSAVYEGFPLSVLDAAARGVPLMARHIPAFDGSPVHQAETAAALAEDVCRWTHDQSFREELDANNQKLLAAMNGDAFRRQAALLYGIGGNA
jgi:glycosyltransferase involved in cell wall biosynthesis